MKKNSIWIPLLMLILSLISFMMTRNSSVVVCCICFCLYFLNAVANIKTHFLSLLFGLSCFAFLFGSIVFNPTETINISDENLVNYCSYLALSLSFIQIGNCFSKEIKDINESIKKIEDYRNECKIQIIRKISKKIFWFSFIFCVIEALIRAKYMINYGYVYLYNHPYVMTSGINGVITDLALINGISLTIMLSCLPKVKDVKFEFTATFIYGLLILLSGARAKLVNSMFLFISYIFLTNFSYEKRKLNFKKISKYIIISVILLSFLSSLFMNVVSYRSGVKNSNNTNNGIVQLITSEGSTWKILINTFYIYDETSPIQHVLFYSMPLIKTVTLQFVFKKIGISFLPTETYTSDFALKSYDYSSYYAYVINPALYLSGGGIGSSYLAESYMFGRGFGIVFHSILIGLFFAYVSSNSKKYRILENAYILSVLSNIFWSPRASALASFFSFFSFSNIIVWILVFFYVSAVYTQKRHLMKKI